MNPMNGTWGEIITFIPGCGNGHLEGVRGPWFRSFFKHLEQEVCWDRNVLRWKCVPVQIPCTSYYLRLTSLWLSFLTCKNGIILIVPVLSGLVGNPCCRAGIQPDGGAAITSTRPSRSRGCPKPVSQKGGVWKWDAEMAHRFYSGTQLARTHHYEKGCKMGISCVFRERKKETARIFSKDRAVSC